MTNNQLSGIIDFGDASYGDPAYDFTSFYLDLDPDSFKELIKAYGISNQFDFIKKVHAISLLELVEDLMYEHIPPKRL